ncbi:hypothetical protein MTBBW1_1670063 [Desulfamplus magnetovallimortis]|uniref:Uncharacterized protein n=1 Tax=Desulfamplus magnetovallimortis TaxID=1246637 RepID=A0A1W1H988_9BACT|nr:hypothetical protein MTBBW1_1670063 [Desulfamplus magnetovallimortis]
MFNPKNGMLQVKDARVFQDDLKDTHNFKVIKQINYEYISKILFFKNFQSPLCNPRSSSFFGFPYDLVINNHITDSNPQPFNNLSIRR